MTVEELRNIVEAARSSFLLNYIMTEAALEKLSDLPEYAREGTAKLFLETVSPFTDVVEDINPITLGVLKTIFGEKATRLVQALASRDTYTAEDVRELAHEYGLVED